ncbi:MAG: hypothetical protein GX242_04605 [Clostridiales bacterium]|nr:hypothetical protein [Clostridiales bacterium]
MKRDIGIRFALAGVGAALSIIFITLSYFVKNLSLSFTVMASVGVMLPLTKNYYKEGLLTCIASGVIGFFIANINVIPFVLASSFYVVFTIFWHNSNFNKIMGILIKILYSFLVFFVLYKVASLIIIDFDRLSKLNALNPAVLYILFNIVFTLAFVVYDFLIIQTYQYIKSLLGKVSKK